MQWRPTIRHSSFPTILLKLGDPKDCTVHDLKLKFNEVLTLHKKELKSRVEMIKSRRLDNLLNRAYNVLKRSKLFKERTLNQKKFKNFDYFFDSKNIAALTKKLTKAHYTEFTTLNFSVWCSRFDEFIRLVSRPISAPWVFADKPMTRALQERKWR